MRDYRRLDCWQGAQRFVVDVYTVTNGFPRSELFGLTGQLRRSSVSIASNIAEGCGRESKRELLRFLEIASGSASECESQLILAAKLHFLGEVPAGDLIARADHLRRQIHNLRKHLRSDLGEA